MTAKPCNLERMQMRFNLQWHIRLRFEIIAKPYSTDTLILLSKVQFGPLQYPLRSHMSDLHLFIVANFFKRTSISWIRLVGHLRRRRHSVALLFCTVIHWWWLEHHSWVELALSPQLAAEQVEADRDRNHDSGETAK